LKSLKSSSKLQESGEVAEWLKATVSKTVIPGKTGIAGSNPALSAINACWI
jgi:hypothetical protein